MIFKYKYVSLKTLTPFTSPKSLKLMDVKLTIVFGKVVYKMRVHDFLLQQIFFVEEEDNRRVLEPGVRDDRLEQGFRLIHPVLSTHTLSLTIIYSILMNWLHLQFF